MDTANQLVDAAASVGRATSAVRLVVTHLVALPFLWMGLWLWWWRTEPRSARVPGRVVRHEGRCPADPDAKTGDACRMVVQYAARNGVGETTEYTVTQTVSGAPPALGTTATVWYDPDDPGADPTLLDPALWRWLGAVLVVVVAGVLGFSWFRWYLLRRSRALAALAGGEDVMQIPNRVFNQPSIRRFLL